MKILKVLLVVLLVVNLTTGLFFMKKKKVYVHHPPPVYQQYAAPHPYTYSYYYQPIPYYYYEPVHAAPVIPTAPAIRTASAIPIVPATPATPAAPPAPCTKSSHVAHLSSKQALPVFEPARFTSKSKDVEIIPSVGFQMGTKTDVIEVHKSQGTYIELPSEAVLIGDTNSITPTVTKTNKNVTRKMKRPAKTTLIKLKNDESAKSNSVQVLGPKAVPSLVDTASRGIIDKNSQAIESGVFTIDVRTTGKDIEASPKFNQNNADNSSAQLIEKVTLPVNDEISVTENEFATVSIDDPISDVLLNAKVLEQNSASIRTSELADELNSTPVDALTFPEVQQLLNELIKHEEFDEKRLKKDTISSGGVQSTKSVEIDPQVSYSRVVRQ